MPNEGVQFLKGRWDNLIYCNHYENATAVLPNLDSRTEQHDAKTHDDHADLFSIILDEVYVSA